MPVEYANIPALGELIGLYSHVARAGQLTFFAGMAAIGDGGEVIGRDDFEVQLHAAFDQLSLALSAEELTPSNIVQLTTYLVRESDIDLFYRVRASVYERLFPEGRYPPHVLLVVQRLVDADMLVEIQAVASR